MNIVGRVIKQDPSTQGGQTLEDDWSINSPKRVRMEVALQRSVNSSNPSLFNELAVSTERSAQKLAQDVPSKK